MIDQETPTFLIMACVECEQRFDVRLRPDGSLDPFETTRCPRCGSEETIGVGP